MTMEQFPQPIVEQKEKKQTFFEKIDASFRDKDTAFARLLEVVSPEKGEEYLNSRLKRFLDLSIAVPAAIISTPVVAVIAIAKKLEDGGTAFFIQERYKKIQTDETNEAQTFNIIKIRSMVEGAAKQESQAITRDEKKDVGDHRITRLGKILRNYKLDELPQLYQTLTRELSLIGIRPASKGEVNRLEGRVDAKLQTSDTLFNKWKDSYNKGPLGLSGIMQVRGSGKIVDEERFHYDIFYTKNASLGLDLYLLWATLGRILGTYPRRKSRAKEVKE